MKTIKINKIQNVKSSVIDSSITFEEYINQIKNGFDVNKILMARAVGKGTAEYTTLKEKREAVLFNFNFIDRRRNKNITKHTGLLFFDIDDKTFDINSIDKSNFCVIHNSFGGNGYTLIVKTKDISYHNHTSFKKDYISIATQLGIESYIDESAIKMTQPTVISYDPYIFINEESKTFYSTEDTQKSITLPSKRRKDNIGSVIPFSNKKVKYETTLDTYDEACIYIKEGKEYVECKLPFKKDGTIKKIKEGERRKWISIFAHNLLYINGYINRKQLYTILNGINQKYCIKKLNEGQIYNIIDYKLEVLNKGEIEAFKPRLKKFWVDPSIKQKREVYDAKRKSLSDDKIEDFFGNDILNINKKITQKIIAEYTGLGVATIKRRFKENTEYKKIVKEININKKS